jgi:RNA recognition motif-containing protein
MLLRLVSCSPHPQDAGVTRVNNKLYVGNLPFQTEESDLQTLFSQAGTVSSINVVRDRDTGRARGFAFIEMGNDNEAQAAIDQFNDRPFGGRNLTVNVARPQTPRTGGGFGGGQNRGGRRSEPRW